MLEVKNISNLSGKTKPLKVAVTGNAGSGKSTVCSRFQELGIPTILLDDLARDAVAPGSAVLGKIAKRFGEGVLRPDGRLDRKALRRLMLKTPEARRDLEALLHPEIMARMHQRIESEEKKGADGVMIEVPLLFESNLAHLFDLVVLVTADPALQARRLVSRDAVAPDAATALLNAQMPDRYKTQHSDIVINNNGSVSDLLKTVDRCYQMIYEKLKGA